MIPAVNDGGLFMLWGLIVAALLGFLLAFLTHSPGWLGLGLAVGLLGSIGAVLVFIERHVRASSRPEHMTERELEALRSSMHRPAADGDQRLPPPGAA